MFQLSFYNRHGFPRNKHALSLWKDLEYLLARADILCLQETWLFEQDLHCLNNIHTDFVGFGAFTTKLQSGLCTGQAPGESLFFSNRLCRIVLNQFILTWIGVLGLKYSLMVSNFS